ncbi:MAG: ABC transporter substrate-binding protein [Pseudomonadota bacterium]
MRKDLSQILVSATALFMLPLASADQACEDFLKTTLSEDLEHIKSDEAHTSGQLDRIEHLISDHIDIHAIAKFTFGKYYDDLTQSEFRLYEEALLEHFAEVISQNLEASHTVSAEVLDSIDRSKSDCIVESAIYRDGLEEILVLWRVIRRGDEHHIVDIALKENGNQIWLSLELRAQVMVVYERTRGDVAAVIQELGLS